MTNRALREARTEFLHRNMAVYQRRVPNRLLIHRLSLRNLVGSRSLADSIRPVFTSFRQYMPLASVKLKSAL
jgi:hypothetical protein